MTRAELKEMGEPRFSVGQTVYCLQRSKVYPDIIREVLDNDQYRLKKDSVFPVKAHTVFATESEALNAAFAECAKEIAYLQRQLNRNVSAMNKILELSRGAKNE